MSNKVVKAENTTLAVADVDIFEDVGAGVDAIGKEDVAIPFYRILQATSPQLKKNDSKFIEGARGGQIFNSVTNRAFDEIVVVPISYVMQYIEWKPREMGGGLVKVHGKGYDLEKLCVRDDKGRYVNDAKNIISQTATYLVVRVDENTGEYDTGIIAMESTQLKKSRLWNSLIMGCKITNPKDGMKVQAPFFYNSFKLSTKSESNDKGGWEAWNIVSYKPTLELKDGKSIYLEARNIHKAFKSGEIGLADTVPPTDDEFEGEGKTVF